MGLVFQLAVNDFAKFLERIAQRIGRTSAGFAMAFGHFLLQCRQCSTHCSSGLRTHFRVNLGFGLLGRCLGGYTAGGTQLIGPHWNGGQRRTGIGRSGHGQAQGGLEGVPHHQQLAA